MEPTRCGACGSDRAALYREGPDRQLGGADRYRLVRCLDCGLIYLNPRPVPGEMARYYPADYEPFTRRERPGRLARWSYRRYLDKRCRRVERWQPAGRLLDVGCGTGDFLARAGERGWQVQGVETSRPAAEVARREHGLDVFAGPLAQAPLPDRAFDAVTLWDVLEHVPDPRAELAVIYRVLADDGLLLIELPNPGSFDAALFGGAWIGLDMPRHFYVFPPAVLDRLLAQAGFRVLSRRCASGGYGAFAISLKLASQERPWRWLRQPAAVLARSPVLQWALAPYVYLAYALGRGPEATVVCRKGMG